MGEDHYFASEPINKTTSHVFTLLSPKDGLGDSAPTFFFHTEAQRHMLEPYRMHLRGFRHTTINADSPNKVDKCLKLGVINEIESERHTDPFEFRDELTRLEHLVRNKLSDESKIPHLVCIYAGILRKARSVFKSQAWLDMKTEEGEENTEGIAKLLYRYISIHVTATTDAIPSLSRTELELLRDEIRYMYKFLWENSTLRFADTIRIPGFKPDPSQEAQLNYNVAHGIRLVGLPSQGSLGYMAARRALEIKPDDEDIQREILNYQGYEHRRNAYLV